MVSCVVGYFHPGVSFFGLRLADFWKVQSEGSGQ